MMAIFLALIAGFFFGALVAMAVFVMDDRAIARVAEMLPPSDGPQPRGPDPFVPERYPLRQPTTPNPGVPERRPRRPRQ
jgi:hypothetical protein